MIPLEEWRSIAGFDGYEVSSYGNVRSVDRKVLVSSKRGVFCRRCKGKTLTPVLDGRGNYLHVTLGNRKAKNVHRLVAEAFVPNPLNLPEVNHIDENKLNNRADNLEWCDHVYNNNYGSKPGSTRGENNPCSKFSESTIRELKSSYVPNDKEFGIAGLAKRYGISQTHVCAIIKGRRWGWMQ